ILRLVKDPEVADPIRFLRAREIVHFQRFGEALRALQEDLNSKNFYAFNPSFDCQGNQANHRCNAELSVFWLLRMTDVQRTVTVQMKIARDSPVVF
ncbi:MAG: hypothetical protein ACLRVS_04805, partial [Lachnospiraceae bacterium]